MGRQREVFRIEELGTMRHRPAAVAPAMDGTPRHAEMMAELRGLRETIAALETAQAVSSIANQGVAFKGELDSVYDAVQRTKQEIATLALTSFTNPDMGRVSGELKAVVTGTESATHRILRASEEIEEAAKTLAAASKNTQDGDLARDILDQVTTIFEACNFQDLAGQRVTKVMATLKFLEEHVLRLMEIWGGLEQLADVTPAAEAERAKHPKLINGPKLDGDLGCVTQQEIDAMFATLDSEAKSAAL